MHSDSQAKEAQGLHLSELEGVRRGQTEEGKGRFTLSNASAEKGRGEQTRYWPCFTVGRLLEADNLAFY